MQQIFRIAHAGDRAALRAFLHRLSPRTVQARYLSAWTGLTGLSADRETQRLLDRDEARHVVLVAVDGAAIRGMGEFVVGETAGAAELAVVVEDAFQGRGIGRLLFRHLEELALQQGISAFTGDVGYRNQRVQRLLRMTGRQLGTQLGFGVVRFSLQL